MAFPPAFAGNYANVVINSTAQAELARRRGIPSTIIPNVFDFENPPEDDDHGSDLREELGIHDDEILVLQPTRVVNRKGIEHAVELVRQMSRHPRKRICLVVSHNAGDEGYEYFDTLKDLALEAGIRMLFIGDRVDEDRSDDDHGRKRERRKGQCPKSIGGCGQGLASRQGRWRNVLTGIVGVHRGTLIVDR